MQVTVYDNGFVKVGEYYVQGIQNTLNATGSALRDANFVPTTSCTCPKGYERTNEGRGTQVWCDHKKAAYKHLIELRKKV